MSFWGMNWVIFIVLLVGFCKDQSPVTHRWCRCRNVLNVAVSSFCLWSPFRWCELICSWPGGCPVKVMWCVSENLGKTDLLLSEILQQTVYVAIWDGISHCCEVHDVQLRLSNQPFCLQLLKMLCCSLNIFESKIPGEMLERLIILMIKNNDNDVLRLAMHFKGKYFSFSGDKFATNTQTCFSL